MGALLGKKYNSWFGRLSNAFQFCVYASQVVQLLASFLRINELSSNNM